MNIYEISCYSKCGSYFNPYLQSLTIIAKDKEHAILLAEEWLTENGERFIYNKSKWNVNKSKWNVDLLSPTKDKGVIAFHCDSDY